MHNDPPEDGTGTTRVADPCAIPEAPHGASAGPSAGEGCPTGVAGDPGDLLGELGDALLVAYRLAVEDGDPVTVALIGKALLQTGRRLARGLSPADVGIPCH